METILDRSQVRGEALDPALVRFVRGVAIAVVVVVPLAVVPWGRLAYTYIKSLLTVTLAAAGILGWIGAYLVGRRPRWQGTLPELALWAFLLAALLSMLVSVDIQTSLMGGLGRDEGLLTVSAYAALYFLGVHFFGSARGFSALIVPAAVAAAVAIGYGALQAVLPPQFAAEAIIKEWYGRIGIPRIGSTLGGPIVFGGYVAFFLPVLCALALLRPNRFRVLWIGVAFVAVLDLALTLTRAAWGAAAIAMGSFVVAIGPEMRETRKVVMGGLTAAIAMSALLLTIVVSTPAQIGSRVTTAVDAAGTSSLGQHLYIWKHVGELIRARPLLGWGLENLGAVFPYDRASLIPLFGSRPVSVDRAHNDLLQVAVSVGVPGALAYACFWALVVVAGVRLYRRQTHSSRLWAAAALSGLMGYLVQAQFSFSAVAFTPLAWLFAGAICGWESGPEDAVDPSQGSLGGLQVAPSTAGHTQT